MIAFSSIWNKPKPLGHSIGATKLSNDYCIPFYFGNGMIKQEHSYQIQRKYPKVYVRRKIFREQTFFGIKNWPGVDPVACDIISIIYCPFLVYKLR